MSATPQLSVTPWYVNAEEGHTQNVARSQSLAREASLLRSWCEEVALLGKDAEKEASSQADEASLAVQQRLQQLDVAEEVRMLMLDGIAGVVDVPSRRRLKRQRQKTLAQGDSKLCAAHQQRKVHLADRLFRHTNRQQHEIESNIENVTNVFAALGTLVEDQMERMVARSHVSRLSRVLRRHRTPASLPSSARSSGSYNMSQSGGVVAGPYPYERADSMHGSRAPSLVSSHSRHQQMIVIDNVDTESVASARRLERQGTVDSLAHSLYSQQSARLRRRRESADSRLSRSTLRTSVRSYLSDRPAFTAQDAMPLIVNAQSEFEHVRFVHTDVSPFLYVFEGSLTLIHEDVPQAPPQTPRWGTAMANRALRPTQRFTLSPQVSQALHRLGALLGPHDPSSLTHKRDESDASLASTSELGDDQYARRCQMLFVLQRAIVLTEAVLEENHERVALLLRTPDNAAPRDASLRLDDDVLCYDLVDGYMTAARLEAVEAELDAKMVELALLEDDGDGEAGGSKRDSIMSSPAKSEDDLRALLEHLGADEPEAAGQTAAVSSCQDLAQLSAVCLQALSRLQQYVKQQGRFYFEVHAQNRTDHWALGVCSRELVDVALSDQLTAQHSVFEMEEALDARADLVCMGLSSTGRVSYGGKLHEFAWEQIANAACIGVLVDTTVGSVRIFADSEDCGVAFGVGASAFPEHVQREQARTLRTQTYYPVFALLGAKRREQPGSKNSGSRRTSRRKSTAVVARRRSTQFDMHSAGAAQSASGAMSHSMFKQDSFVKPRLCVNFGGRPFVNWPAPRGSVPLDSYVPREDAPEFSTDVLASVAFAPFKTKVRRKPKLESAQAVFRSRFSVAVAMRDQRVGFDSRPHPEKQRGVAFAPSGLRATEGGEVSELELFRRTLEPDSLISWSSFPPASMRVRSAATTIQRAARFFLARCRRKHLVRERNHAAAVIQGAYRRHRTRFRRKYGAVALIGQRLYRGWLVRKHVRLCQERYGVDYLTGRDAAVRIQALFRGYVARRDTKAQRALLAEQVAHVENVVRLVQRMWRWKRERNRSIVAHETSTIRSLLVVEKLYHHVRLRRAVLDLDPTYVKRVKLTGAERRRNDEACTKIQKVFRGYLVRRQLAAQKLRQGAAAERFVHRCSSFVLHHRLDETFGTSRKTRILKHFFAALGYHGPVSDAGRME